MNELQAVVAATKKAESAGQTVVLATVVRVAGSSYRMPGAHMVVTDDGWQAGSISGGCLENDVVKRGTWLTAGHRAVVMTYDTNDDDDLIHGAGLGCGGTIDVLVERITSAGDTDLIGFVEHCLAHRVTGVVASVLDADADGIDCGCRVLFDANGIAGHDVHSMAALAAITPVCADVLGQRRSMTRVVETAAGHIEAFFEFIRPPASLLLFGAGHDAMPLVTFAKAAGYRVTVIDGRPAYIVPSRFPQADRILLCRPDQLGARIAAGDIVIDGDCVALVMTHHFLSDLQIVTHLLCSSAAYIGVLGPKRRTLDLLSRLSAAGMGIDNAARSRLYAPVGLDIGADTPEAIALSILAEIQAVLAGRHGSHLRDRIGSIHDN